MVDIIRPPALQPVVPAGTSPSKTWGITSNHPGKGSRSTEAAFLPASLDPLGTYASLFSTDHRTSWRKVDRSSALSSNNLKSRASLLNFDVDLYKVDQMPLTFNVRCLMLITPVGHDFAADHPIVSAPDRVEVRQGKQWIDINAWRGTDTSYNTSLMQMMQDLLTSAIKLPTATQIAPPKPVIDPALLAYATEDLRRIFAIQEVDETEFSASALETFGAHFQRFCFPDALEKFIESFSPDAEAVELAFRAMLDEGATRRDEQIRGYLMKVASSHARPSYRYAAVEALSYHLDKRTRDLFAVRLKDEKNRTVVASLAAAVK